MGNQQRKSRNEGGSDWRGSPPPREPAEYIIFIKTHTLVLFRMTDWETQSCDWLPTTWPPRFLCLSNSLKNWCCWKLRSQYLAELPCVWEIYRYPLKKERAGGDIIGALAGSQSEYYSVEYSGVDHFSGIESGSSSVLCKKQQKTGSNPQLMKGASRFFVRPASISKRADQLILRK